MGKEKERKRKKKRGMIILLSKKIFQVLVLSLRCVDANKLSKFQWDLGRKTSDIP